MTFAGLVVQVRSTASFASGNRSDPSRPAGTHRKPELVGRLFGGVLGGAVVEEQFDETVGIAVGRGAAERTDDDAQADLLEAFAGRGLVGGLARLALAAGEFPVAGIDGPGRALPAPGKRPSRRTSPIPTGIGSPGGSSFIAVSALRHCGAQRPGRDWPPGPWPG